MYPLMNRETVVLHTVSVR